MQIRLPRLGEGADSGSVVTVLVKEGDTVKKDQPIIELENEKAVASIPSTAAGVVQTIHVKPGDKISVGQPIVTLSGAGGSAAFEKTAPGPAAEAAKPAARPAAQPAAQAPVSTDAEPADEEVQVSASGEAPPAAPSVRRIARELGIDLRLVKGSERGGRIVLADVKNYIELLQRKAVSGQKPAVGGRPVPSAPQIDFAKFGPIKKEPLTSLRQTIAQKMVESWTAIPHVTQFDEADITDLLTLKKKHDAAYEKKGVNLTLTVFLLKILVNVLKKHPKFNASLDEASNEMVFKQYYHIGIAVDTEAGLLVPVIRNVDKKSLLDLSKELNALAEKTRQRKLTTEDLQGGTFTVSNQGGIGGGAFTPIIKRPEVAILGLARGVQKPLAKEGKVEVRSVLPMGLSYDHRALDGADAARFIRDLVQAIERVNEKDMKV